MSTELHIYSIWILVKVIWVNTYTCFQSSIDSQRLRPFSSMIQVVILFCGTSRTKDMAKRKNRKELILKNTKSILNSLIIIADSGAKLANRKSTRDYYCKSPRLWGLILMALFPTDDWCMFGESPFAIDIEKKCIPKNISFSLRVLFEHF